MARAYSAAPEQSGPVLEELLGAKALGDGAWELRGEARGSIIAFDRDRNTPLANLFVSVLQRLGVDADHFASGTGTLTGLKPS